MKIVINFVILFIIYLNWEYIDGDKSILVQIKEIF